MAEAEIKDTIIVVGATRMDGYGNLWVTPKGGGDDVKVGVKRVNLHPIFQQGKAVMCHWEVYMNKPYVADAKLVEGELPHTPSEPTPEGVQEAYEKSRKDLEKMSKGDWDEKDRRTRKSIERQTALNVAVEIVKLNPPTEKVTEKVLATAKRLEEYLEKGD